MHPLPRHIVVWMRVVPCVVGICLSAVAAAQAPAQAPVPLQQAGACAAATALRQMPTTHGTTHIHTTI